MSNLENLTQKIVDDAKEKADEIKTNADKKALVLVANRVKEANERKEKIISKATQEAAMMKERVVSSAELKIRDEKLVVKNIILDKVFEVAKKELLSINDKDYLNFVKSSLKEIEYSSDAVLNVPKGKMESLKDLGETIKVVENDSVESGFMIFDEDIIYNYTFRSLVDDIREEMEALIAQKLFEE
ncbi:MAG: V-type ATP synthase subunit E [Gudongella sp.]|nr:V-type ATP synthase subunit E [Gudongella sp.]